MNEVMTEILTKSLHHDICSLAVYVDALLRANSVVIEHMVSKCNYPVVYIGPTAPKCHLVRTGSRSIQAISHPKGT